jgi:hypothetical protein
MSGRTCATASTKCSSIGDHISSPNVVTASVPPGRRWDHSARAAAAMSSTKKMPSTQTTASNARRRAGRACRPARARCWPRRWPRRPVARRPACRARSPRRQRVRTDQRAGRGDGCRRGPAGRVEHVLTGAKRQSVDRSRREELPVVARRTCVVLCSRGICSGRVEASQRLLHLLSPPLIHHPGAMAAGASYLRLTDIVKQSARSSSVAGATTCVRGPTRPGRRAV